MHPSFLAALLVCVLAAPLDAEDHRTARVEISAGASLELLTRTPDLGILVFLWPDTSITLEAPELDVMREAHAEMIKLPIASTLWGRASLGAVASNADTEVSAIAQPTFQLYNHLDTPMEVRFRVTVPGAFPRPFPAEPEPTPFFWRSSIDDNYSEISHAIINISVVGGPRVEGTPIRVFEMFRETRPAAGLPVDTPSGPEAFDIVGVPFQRDFSVMIPPARTVFELPPGEEGVIEEYRGQEFGLRVLLVGFVHSEIAAAPEVPFSFEEADFCAAEPPRAIVPLTPTLSDRLCNAARADGASPACSCHRDNAFRSQRCAFTFPDLFVTLQTPGAVPAGQPVDAEWTILPWATEGDYSLVPELWDGRKWIPLDTKSKLGGKLIEGKESKAKLTFTMPSTLVMMRTRVFHLPNGAKSPIESHLDASIALLKPKK